MHQDEQCWAASCVTPLVWATAAHGYVPWHGSGIGARVVGNALRCGGFAMGRMLGGV